ncbi:MAG: hypothetical protein V3G42_12430, partial [Oscillospiraceae bacterium]
AQTNISFLPLTIYALRWHIETAYYEQKKFWSLGNYLSCQIHQDLFFDAFVRQLKHIKNTFSHHTASIPCLNLIFLESGVSLKLSSKNFIPYS